MLQDEVRVELKFELVQSDKSVGVNQKEREIGEARRNVRN